MIYRNVGVLTKFGLL